jgi:predicted dehydrogenase
MSGVALHAVYSTNGARGKSYANRYKAAYTTSDYADLLQDPDIDAVLIVSRNQQHAPQALAALRAGKHVFVEKPMALTEDECRDLVRAQRDTGRQLGVGFNRRFAPFYLDRKRALAGRASPALLNCRVNSPGISGSYWMADPAIGGAILGEACHFVDLFHWLLDAEFEAVTSYALPIGKGEPLGENNMVSSFRFDDGSVANLTYCTVGSKTSGGERVEAFAPGIGVETEDFKRLTVKANLRRGKSKFFAEKGYDAQMAAFFESIRTGTPYPVSGIDGTRSTVACLRMLDSAKLGGEREIDWQSIVD